MDQWNSSLQSFQSLKRDDWLQSNTFWVRLDEAHNSSKGRTTDFLGQTGDKLKHRANWENYWTEKKLTKTIQKF